VSQPLWSRSASWLARAIPAREVSSVDAVEACLARIADVNPRINAVVAFAPDALERARQADAEVAAGTPLGPLHGVPFTIKDSMDTAGVVTSAGTAGWRERVPERDGTVVARLRAAGGILVGKTNTPEFTWANETENDVYGRTSNPYDVERTTGGSSGGSAAVVAAGGSPFDIGSDSGNSIRQPAHLCGVAGIKPTSGRVPRTGHWPGYGGLFESFTQLGPIARRVDDLELVLRAIAGPDGQDPHVVPMPLRDVSGVDLAGLRVAWFDDNGIRTPTPETQVAVRTAVAAIAATGATCEERVPDDIADARPAWEGVIRADGFAWLWRLIEAAGTAGHGSYDRLGWVRARPGEPVSGDQVSARMERADEVRGRLLRWFAPFDLLVSPVLPAPAVRHGESMSPEYGDTYSEIHNLTGWPAVVVRAGTSPEGLPLGVQLVAQPWREDVALAAARVVEAATGGWQAPAL
jgi:Asp-tRNA(Asn)/Glu-tRNA(Gln) amidotransferase A subunit family amidase